MEMTKEQLIKRLIEMRKTGADETLDRVCESSTGCEDCPLYQTGRLCSHQVIDYLLDHIIDDEAEHQETNLEHFRGNVAFDKTNGIVLINLINGWKNNYSCPHEDAIDWLLEPYEEPPKPKYKLTQFEYDLLQTAKWSTHLFGEYDYLMNLKAIGYFQDITSAMAIVNVLDNAEVIDNG